MARRKRGLLTAPTRHPFGDPTASRCARAAIALMQSRRRIGIPQSVELRKLCSDYSRVLRRMEGFGVSLHNTNLEPLMSAPEQTFA